MNSNPPRAIAAILALTTVTVLFAQTPSKPDELPADVVAKIHAALKTRMPDVEVSQIHNSVIPGLYEILAPDGIAYVDASGEHLVMGQIIETKTHRNVTKDRWNTLSAIDFNSLPLQLAFKTVHGKGTRQIAVFADPLCPYCQELETNLAKVDDITVYTFLYPLESVHPGATVKAHQLWCAPDHDAAWSKWMVDKQAPTERECKDDPAKELAALGDRLRINSTPTIFFHSGKRASGLPPADVFNKMLQAESGAVVASRPADSPPASRIPTGGAGAPPPVSDARAAALGAENPVT